MNEPMLPALIDPTDFESHRTDELVLIDLSAEKNRARFPVPGSIWLDYGRIVANRPPVSGLLPPVDELAASLGEIGIDRETPVVAFDDEGGGRAARLLWTLDHLGHRNHALLDGGLVAWVNAGLPLGDDPPQRAPRTFAPELSADCVADAALIANRLDDPGLQLVDARSSDEYSGQRRFAARGGHIPGAIHCDWLELMDRGRDMRLHPAETLQSLMADKGIDAGRETVVYCQTHHRSSLTYYALRLLGFDRVRGYPGSWSDWGNRDDTPVEP